MRRTSILLSLIIAIALVVGTLGCGGGSGEPAAAAPAPEQILASAMAAAGNLTTATGSLDVSITLDADTSELPDEAKAIFDNPITLSGTFATGSEPQAADLDIALGLGGETLKFALKASASNAWVQLNNQWYETPPELLQAMAQDPQAETKSAELMKLISDLGVDPVTWMKDLTVVGQETLDGVTTYHVKGTPDMAKMLVDVMSLMKSEEFTNMLGSASAATGGMDLSSMMPSPDELQQTQNQIAEMFKNVAVELWIGKDDSMPRKVVLTATITPPPGEDADGVNGISISATILLENINKPVTVQAPESPLPYTDLEKMLEENPEQILGPLGGLLQGLGGGF